MAFRRGFIERPGYPAVHAAATAVGRDPLNLVVWSKTNAGMGSLYRSAHELLPLSKKGKAAHVNNVELGGHGRWRSTFGLIREPRRLAPMPSRAYAYIRP
jgi:hypothetical protein